MPLTDKQESEQSTVKNEGNESVAQNHPSTMDSEAFTPMPTTPLVPGEIGHGRLTINQHHLLGEGGFGKVYSGHYQNQDVAIKVCSASSSLGARDIKEFMHEVKVMMRLNHPSIVTCFGYTKVPYQIVMACCVNGSLYKYLQAGQNIPWDLRGLWVRQLTEGLVYLHGKNMIHRDIKSLNVLLDGHLNAKWADFGLAGLKNATSSSIAGALDNSSAPKIAGSVRWMSPEQLSSNELRSKSSDIYSFGVLLWEICTQQVPYKDFNLLLLINTIAMQGKTLTIPEDIPKKHDYLEDIMQGCWQHNPQLRPSAQSILRKVNGEDAQKWHFFSLNAQQEQLLNYVDTYDKSNLIKELVPLAKAHYGKRYDKANHPQKRVYCDERLRTMLPQSCLTDACRSGYVARITRLLAHGFPVDKPDLQGYYPLHRLMEAPEKKFETLLALLETQQGFSVEPKGAYQRTPLHTAALFGHLTGLKWLLAQGANPNANEKGRFQANTPLHNAAYCGHIDIICTLLDHPQVNARLTNKTGVTALAESLLSENLSPETLESVIIAFSDAGLCLTERDKVILTDKKAILQSRNADNYERIIQPYLAHQCLPLRQDRANASTTSACVSLAGDVSPVSPMI